MGSLACGSRIQETPRGQTALNTRAVSDQRSGDATVATLRDFRQRPENLAVISYRRAFETLFTLMKMPHGLSYDELKLDPTWDNLRDDSRFGDLLVQAAKPFG